MSPVKRRRLYLVSAVVGAAVVATGLTLHALQQNINLFFSPSEVIAGEAPIGHRIRVGGLVAPGSIRRDNETLMVSFDVTDLAERVTVHYSGILPDLFRENQGIVVRGLLEGGNRLQAEEVLARHDENYMPPEAVESLERAGLWQHHLVDR